MSLIDFGANQHTTVVGKSQMGKTFAVHRSAEKVKQGVLFFNAQQIAVSNAWTKATGADDADMLVKSLRKGHKINFYPNRENRWKQLKVIVDVLYKASESSILDIYVIADECHLMAMSGQKDGKMALNAVKEIATTGLRWGLKGIFISQRMALIDNTLMTQSNQYVFFRTSMENQYMEAKDFPFDDIQAKVISGGEFNYVVYDELEIRGPFKV